jgi:ABC transporter.
LLKLEKVTKIFHQGTADERVALNNIHLTLKKGDFVTVIGSNGAGKSTLLNVISGRLLPDGGTVELAGTDVTKVPEFRRSRFIGRVFQDPMTGTAPSMTIEENLAMAYSRNRRRTLKPGVTKRRREFFRETLANLGLGLENRLNAKAGLLSGGERQALSLVMAAFTEPDLLLLDEHTAALDPARAELITRLTGDIVTRLGLTTIMVTHNMQQALELGNRLVMMDHGEIVFEASDRMKTALTVDDLLAKFREIRGESLAADRSLLA